ncbi:MAG: SDR family oxidoreductase [Chloroflexota bacterium]|nr:MAG: SDR family oxidoreductase [Chloroflexota bacterium]
MAQVQSHRFEGRTALVTGGASGIGAATVERLAAEGARVIIADRDTDRAASVAASVTGAGGRAVVQPVDLTDAASIQRLGQDVAAHTSALHVLVNCAGIVRRALLAETGAADWNPQMMVNLHAPALLTQALLPLLKHEGASIVNVSSEGGFRARPGSWVYDATKAGICAFTRSIAAELIEYGIRVNAVAPGWTVTEMHFGRAADPAGRKRELEEHPHERSLMGRLARPSEIAAAIAFLASDDASYITATVLHVNGGSGVG